LTRECMRVSADDGFFNFIKPHGKTMFWQPINADSWNEGSQDSLQSSMSYGREPMRGLTSHHQGVAARSCLETGELEAYVEVLTPKIGAIPSDLENGLSVCLEVFALSEGLGISPCVMQTLWQHSVRTGYMAALIAMDQHVSRSLVWQAFIGGLLHDIGMLIFLTQQPQVFSAVVDLAQCQGQELAIMEQNFLGTTHAECGARFLSRWGVSTEVLTIVAFHDQPFQVPHSAVCPLTTVYIANMLEGGGIAQDGDGLVGFEGEAYLRRLGLWDHLPLYQGWMRELPHLSG